MLTLLLIPINFTGNASIMNSFSKSEYNLSTKFDIQYVDFNHYWLIILRQKYEKMKMPLLTIRDNYFTLYCLEMRKVITRWEERGCVYPQSQQPAEKSTNGSFPIPLQSKSIFYLLRYVAWKRWRRETTRSSPH